MQRLIDIAAVIRFPSEYPHHMLFFRNLSYQQFIYQRLLNVRAFARQFILFADLDEQHLFKVHFKKK